MNPFITCANTFTNSTTPNSLTDIDAFRDSRACLTPGGIVPINNNCGSAIEITSTTQAGSNVNSTTDGGATGCSGLALRAAARTTSGTPLPLSTMAA